MKVLYREHQLGWMILIILAPLVIFLLLAYVFQWGNRPISLLPFLLIEFIMVVVGSLFYKMTTFVMTDYIQVVYGIGAIRINFPLDGLRSVSTFKSKWYYGLGIRITPKGMLYNMHSLQSVKLHFDGSRSDFSIGSRTPEKLQSVLNELIRTREP